MFQRLIDDFKDSTGTTLRMISLAAAAAMALLVTTGFLCAAAFVLVLLVPFAYLLSVGALEWGPVRDVLERLPGPLLRTDAAVYDPNQGDAGDAVRPDVEAA